VLIIWSPSHLDRSNAPTAWQSTKFEIGDLAGIC
jgi:hypothetical protein